MEIINKDLPLVSVPVIVYNSAKTVIETLDSIYNQTYPNLELIVSDDCSTDNTVEICRQWIEEHKDRFVRTALLTVEKNTGTSGNCNRAQDACQGEWVKGIAGDDLLVPECIQIYLDYILKHKDMDFLFSKVEAFGPNPEIVARYNGTDPVFDYSFFKLSSKEQLEQFVLGDVHIPAPALIYRKGVYEKYGVTNDVRIPLVEDEPKWINLLRAGAHFDFLDRITVLYRVGHEGAISSEEGACNPKKFDSFLRYRMYYKFPAQYEKDPDKAVEDLIDFVNLFYDGAYHCDSQRIRSTHAYMVGTKIMAPIKWLKKLMEK